MFFDDPQNALSVARTHQRELRQKEQMDRLARQVGSSERPVPDRCVVAFHWLAFLKTRARSFPRGLAHRPAFRSRLTRDAVRQR